MLLTKPTRLILALLIPGIVSPAFTVPVARATEVDFQRDILPLFEEHCIDCHSEDFAESKLALDSPLAALRGGDSGERVIAPGDSESSYLIERVTSDNPDLRMPPDADPLSDAEVQRLRLWINQAAAWQAVEAELETQTIDHWSFQPLQRPTVPALEPAPKDDDATLGEPNPVDAFVGAKLQEVGLSMSERAPRRQLIRRLFLVMHGLPPTPQQVQAFVDDTRPDAWQRLVDEVLESPRYGERWAAHWLDLVRFGETYGFETNRERPHAWPYRDWVIDALNDDKPYDQFIIEQLAGDALGADVATAFLVAGPSDLVKSQEPEIQLVQRQDELADIINTTGTAFLGLTLGCARCHNHKFDPVSQTDYYALQAVFAGVQHGERVLPPSAATAAEIQRLDRDIAHMQQSLAKYLTVENPDLRPAVNANRNVENFTAQEVRFVRFTIEATNSGQPCLDELEIFAADTNVALAAAGAMPSSSGDFVHPLHKLSHINDGLYGNSHSWIASQVAGAWIQIELPRPVTIDRIVWGRDRQGQFADRLPTEYRIESSLDGQQWQPLSGSADRLPFDSGPGKPPEYDFAALSEEESKQARTVHAELQQKLAERDALSASAMVYAGTFSQPGPTHRLYRGEPTAPREQVMPAALQVLSDLQLAGDTPEQQRRLAIAKWIAHADNPLTSRVIVNRLWQFHFGTGIVDTPSDFGGNGTEPSHPQLLDWLASDLIDNGWSLKHIHRRLLLSRAWQQDSRPRSDALAADASSRWLWRFPPRRLEAEAIRDSLLAVSGQLDLKQGGPGFSAFEVEAENVRHYHPKSEYGPQDWRRMIYMTKVRQERDSVFGVFDCPDGSQVTPKRSRSTTPLQSLNLLNSRFVMQQADFFAERMIAQSSSPAERVEHAYRWCFARDPAPDEVQSALSFIDETDWQQFARALLNTNEFVFVP